MPEPDRASAGADLLPQRQGDRAEVRDGCGGRVQAGDAAHVRLELAHPLGTYLLDPLHAVGPGSLRQLAKRPDLRVVHRDDELPVGLVGDRVVGSEALQQDPSLATEPGIERAGPIVDPGMDDPRVPSALVEGQLRLLLQEGQPEVGA